ncbi:ABC transporter permease [Candidatus Bathyarchaeota archaeon]|nr:ABC transporter permease [Candidatus Bathyarchaeota archaeon]
MSVFAFVAWYFPIGLYRNACATDAVDSRGVAVFLNVWAFFVFCSTFANMVIAGTPSIDIAGAIVNVLSIMMFTFCGSVPPPVLLLIIPLSTCDDTELA